MTGREGLLGKGHIGGSHNPFYTAREWDTETGLYFYRARYYGPTTGRFTSEDPILNPVFSPPISYMKFKSNLNEWLEYIASFKNCGNNLFRSYSYSVAPRNLYNHRNRPHPYVYCINNPINMIDPSGLLCTWYIDKDGCPVCRDTGCAAGGGSCNASCVCEVIIDIDFPQPIPDPNQPSPNPNPGPGPIF